MIQKRLFIVSNTFPFNTKSNTRKTGSDPRGVLHTIKGSVQLYPSGNTEFSELYWVAHPGCTSGEWLSVGKAYSDASCAYLPVFVNKPVYDSFYDGFCKSVIWPLFHYFPSLTDYESEFFANYVKVNESFLEVLRKHLRPNDTVWIQDHHLMLLGDMLRKEFPKLNIGFFLHTPFPSYELFRLMPRKWQERIIKGILGADLVGFQTADYSSHFLKSVQRILGLDSEMNIVVFEGRMVKVDVFPMSIDYQKIDSLCSTEKILSAKKALLDKFHDKKILFSFDSFDYTKGILNRVNAVGDLFNHHPNYLERAVLIMLIEPSGEGGHTNNEHKQLIEDAINKINNKFGNSNWQPIIYQYSSLGFEELIIFYTTCNIALFTPLRDGMNLSCKEFVATRNDNQGVLIMSEMAGAAREFTDAITINPNDIGEMSERMHTALMMSEDDQILRMDRMRSRIKQYDIHAWTKDFFMQLAVIKKKQQKFQVRFIEESEKRNIFDHYRSSRKRLFLLDYDGTLVSFTSLPLEAKPNRHLIELLRRLTDVKENEVYIISGRESAALENWIGDIPVNIISEHGAKIKLKNKGWQPPALNPIRWKPWIRAIIEGYVNRCPNSFMEEKEYSLVWHYRNANQEQAKLRCLELLSELTEYTRNLDVQVVPGNKIVEVRNSGIDKGKAVKKILADADYDFILAAGDDRTDEDMFKALPAGADIYSIKIGGDASYANYNLHTSYMMISMLDAISHLH